MRDIQYKYTDLILTTSAKKASKNRIKGFIDVTKHYWFTDTLLNKIVSHLLFFGHFENWSEFESRFGKLLVANRLKAEDYEDELATEKKWKVQEDVNEVFFTESNYLELEKKFEAYPPKNTIRVPGRMLIREDMIDEDFIKIMFHPKMRYLTVEKENDEVGLNNNYILVNSINRVIGYLETARLKPFDTRVLLFHCVRGKNNGVLSIFAANISKIADFHRDFTVYFSYEAKIHAKLEYVKAICSNGFKVDICDKSIGYCTLSYSLNKRP